jgi:RNA polymerase subunit RPABC4/transcription elongation factor Spt4
MSDLLGKIVDGAGQVISQVDQGGQIQSAIAGLRQRLAEADRKRKVNLVKQQIRDLQAQEAQAINALSAQVLALHEAGTLTQPELVSLCRNVDEIRRQLRQQEDELKQLQPPPSLTPSEVRCPHCGAVVVAGAAFCQSCGTGLVAEPAASPARFCIHCGAQLRENARFCPKCGQTVAHS